jgi:hypothetical protein
VILHRFSLTPPVRSGFSGREGCVFGGFGDWSSMRESMSHSQSRPYGWEATPPEKVPAARGRANPPIGMSGWYGGGGERAMSFAVGEPRRVPRCRERLASCVSLGRDSRNGTITIAPSSGRNGGHGVCLPRLTADASPRRRGIQNAQSIVGPDIWIIAQGTPFPATRPDEAFHMDQRGRGRFGGHPRLPILDGDPTGAATMGRREMGVPRARGRACEPIWSYWRSGPGDVASTALRNFASQSTSGLSGDARETTEQGKGTSTGLERFGDGRHSESAMGPPGVRPGSARTPRTQSSQKGPRTQGGLKTRGSETLSPLGPRGPQGPRRKDKGRGPR